MLSKNVKRLGMELLICARKGCQCASAGTVMWGIDEAGNNEVGKR